MKVRDKLRENVLILILLCILWFLFGIAVGTSTMFDFVRG